MDVHTGTKNVSADRTRQGVFRLEGTVTVTGNTANNNTSKPMDFTRIDLMPGDSSHGGITAGSVEHMHTTLGDLPYDLAFYGRGACHKMVVGHRDPATNSVVVDYPKANPDPVAVLLLEIELGSRGR